MKEKVEAVNKLLLQGEPHNISTDEHSGYTGYKPQSVIDALNEVFWGQWGFSEIGSEIVPGDKGALAVAQVQVWLADIEFKPTGWGQNRVTRGDIGDARKGAQTDAIKKALSYFSIGNRAYQGLLKEDNGNKNARPNQQNGSKPVQANKPVNTAVVEYLKPSEVDELRTYVGKVFKFKPEDFDTRWLAYKKFRLNRSIDDSTLTLRDATTLRDFAEKEESKLASVPVAQAG